MTIYADDPDAHVVLEVTDSQGGSLNFTPVVRARDTEITAAWVGSVTTADGVSTRQLNVPLAGLDAGSHALRLVVPGDNDFTLATVYLA